MTNTITIEQANIKIENGKFIIDMDAEILKKMLGIPAVALGTLKVGGEFKLGDDGYIVLEHDGGNTKIISKDFLYSMIFGESNDIYIPVWIDLKSILRAILNLKK